MFVDFILRFCAIELLPVVCLVFQAKSMAVERRRVAFLTEELQETIESAKKETDLLQQARLALIDEVSTQRHCQGGSRVQKIQVTGVNPRFIPLGDGEESPTGYLK